MDSRTDNRTELLQAALESLPQGLAVLEPDGCVVVWNPAAEATTGYTVMERVGRPLPTGLEPLLSGRCEGGEVFCSTGQRPVQGNFVQVETKSGDLLNVMANSLVLRDTLGRQIGTALLFHSTDNHEALPRGESSEDEQVRSSQAEIAERLEVVWEDFRAGGPPFGVLWISVDQAAELRGSHGVGASVAMLEKVKYAISNGLRPGEALGRWGDNEFLAISHETTRDRLAEHARTLAGLARTADFRWWGDRVSLTVSIGAAQVEPEGSLAEMLQAAKTAMLASYHAGGNQITSAPGRQECLPS